MKINFNSVVRVFLTAICLIFVQSAWSQTTNIDFHDLTPEDLPGANQDFGAGNNVWDAPIPNGYAGLQWNNWYVVNLEGVPKSGYINGMIAPPNVAYNAYGNSALISDAKFTLNSAYLTGAWVNDLQVEVQGYVNGILTYDNTYTVNSESPTLVKFNYTNIDEVDFITSGGVNAGYGGVGKEVVMGGLNVSFEPTNVVSDPTNVVSDPTNVVSGPALQATSLRWYYTNGLAEDYAIEFSYTNNGGALSNASTAELFWADGTDISNILDPQPIKTDIIPTNFQGSATDLISSAYLKSPPPGTSNLLLVVDPNNLDGPSSTLSLKWVEYGVDVDTGNGNINWCGVKAAGASFAFVKVTQGTYIQDPKCIANMDEAMAAGLAVGVCHLAGTGAHPHCVLGDPDAEAANFLSRAKNYIGPGFLPPVLALDDNYPCYRGMSLAKWATNWLQYVERRTGIKPIIYASDTTLQNVFSNEPGVASLYTLWIAHPDDNPTAIPETMWRNQKFKQYASGAFNPVGFCQGISGVADLDSFNGDLAALNALRWPVGSLGPGRNLKGADLEGLNLAGADLAGDNLLHANLTDAFLEGADLAGANLNSANLCYASLDNANLKGANCNDADLRDAGLSNANLTGANLRGADLRNADLTNANLSGANLEGANLEGANFTNANLTGANFQNANTTGAVFSEAIAKPAKADHGKS